MNEHVNQQRFLSEAPVNLPANKRDPEFWSDAMVELLSRLDIDYVFLLPGSSYRGLHDSLVNYGRNHKPKMVLTTHEQIAVSMAHGYAKATGRIGVCILHDLVGLMNGSMGVYNAFGDHAPVLVLGGSGPLDPADRRWIDWLHCASTQADIVKNYVKWTEEPTTPQWHLDAIAKAHKVALTAAARPGLCDARLRHPGAEDRRPGDDAGPEILPAGAAGRRQSGRARGGRRRAAQFEISADRRRPLRHQSRRHQAAGRAGRAHRRGLSRRQRHHRVPDRASAERHRRPRDREGSRRRDGDRLPRPVEPARQLHRASRRTSAPGALRAGRKVIDMSFNDLSPSSWSYLRGPAPLVDVQINCDPLFGMQQLNAVIRERLEKDAGARAKVEERKQARAPSATRRCARARPRTRRKGWDDKPIRPGRMVTELWNAVKDKNWLLAMRNSASFPEGIWQFPGAGYYLGTNGGGGVGYGPGAMAGAAIACRTRAGSASA